jgi:hypothetical protein
MQVRVNEAGAEIHCRNDLPSVVADPDRLREVLLNLVSNAIKYNTSANPIVEVGITSIRETHRGIGVVRRSIGSEREPCRQTDMQWCFKVDGPPRSACLRMRAARRPPFPSNRDQQSWCTPMDWWSDGRNQLTMESNCLPRKPQPFTRSHRRSFVIESLKKCLPNSHLVTMLPCSGFAARPEL